MLKALKQFKAGMKFQEARSTPDEDVRPDDGTSSFFCGSIGRPLAVCETVLDAGTLYAGSSGVVSALALLGKKKSLDLQALEVLKEAERVIVVSDAGGRGEALLSLVRAIRSDAEAYQVPALDEWELGNGEAVKSVHDFYQVAGAKSLLGWLGLGLKMAVKEKQTR